MASIKELVDNQQNRESFLDNLAQHSGRDRHQLKDHPFKPLNNLPETTLSGLSKEKLLELAKKNSEAVHVNFQTTTSSQLGGVLDEYIKQYQIKNLILPSFGPDKWSDYQLDSWREGLDVPTVNYWDPKLGRKANEDNANAADGAIGFADYLLAESGTITVATYPEQGRGFHFLPTHYLAIVPQSHLVPRSRQAMDHYDADIKAGHLQTSNINFITGPSNSGDIEMVLVVGVHGPLSMEYVVVTDR